MGPKPPYLFTSRLRLGTIQEADKTAMLRIFQNEAICKTYMIPQFQTREDTLRLFHRLQELSLSDDHVVYGIYMQDRLIGFLNDVETVEDTIEMGYVIHPDYQNNGYATEAFSAVIQVLFSMGYTTVKAGAFAENMSSIRVMEKCGMKRTALEETLVYRGITRHCIYYEILSTL